MHEMLQRAASNAMATRPAVLVQGMRIERPIDVVRATALSADDKRTTLASWASDFCSFESKPAFRRMPGTQEPVSIDEIQAAFRELDRRYSP